MMFVIGLSSIDCYRKIKPSSPFSPFGGRREGSVPVGQASIYLVGTDDGCSHHIDFLRPLSTFLILASILSCAMYPLAWTLFAASHASAKHSTIEDKLPLPSRPLEWGDVNFIHTTDIHGTSALAMYPSKGRKLIPDCFVLQVG
jgi:hypothetical protein